MRLLPALAVVFVRQGTGGPQADPTPCLVHIYRSAMLFANTETFLCSQAVAVEKSTFVTVSTLTLVHPPNNYPVGTIIFGEKPESRYRDF